MATNKAEEVIAKIEMPDAVSTYIDTAKSADKSGPKASAKSSAKSADIDYDPFRFPVEPEAIIFAVAGTGHSHEVIDGYVSCEECHAALYPEPVVEIESYSFDASEQDS